MYPITSLYPSLKWPSQKGLSQLLHLVDIASTLGNSKNVYCQLIVIDPSLHNSILIFQGMWWVIWDQLKYTNAFLAFMIPKFSKKMRAKKTFSNI